MLKDVFIEAESKMKKTTEVLRKEFSAMRAGRANPALLEKIKVEYYGALTPLNQLANISAPEPRLLTVQPWDKSVLAEVEKAILKSDLGLNPSNDGNLLRIAIPQLTEERRQELVKTAKKKAEESKVGIRNIRREANDNIKRVEKDKEISEDEAKKRQEEIQKVTDQYIEEVERVLAIKEKEIMEV
ncbi:MAG: ribosome recycling factor [Clostridia bacterium]|jgi:ribosome recycling factor|nr:ribosome recycling factor [Clostridia bacterium]MDD4145555.1 ribosome recycling factor [Clostridia bacterium]MDD4664969.1 ribosome recycling factor [Clostridia bacterium]